MSQAKDMRKALFGALRIYLVYILTPGFLMMVGMMLRRTDMTAEQFFAESGNFYTVAGFALALLLIRRRCRKKGLSFMEEASLSVRNVNWKKGLGLLGTGIGLSLFVSSVLTLLPDAWMAGYTDSSESIFEGPDQILAVLGVTLAAPVMEEMIFRGFILNRLLGGFSDAAAVVITAALFSLLHVNPIWILYSFLLGILLGHFAMQEENTLYPILLHVGFNVLSIPLNIMNHIESAREVLFQSPLLIVLYGMIGLCAAVLLLRKYYKKEEPLW